VEPPELPFVVEVPKEELDKLLCDSGLLFAINRFILHPEGLVLSLSYEDDDKEFKNPRIMIGRTRDGTGYSFESKLEREELVPKLRRFLSGKIRPLHVLVNFYFGDVK
jgi:hypothetical protein